MELEKTRASRGTDLGKGPDIKEAEYYSLGQPMATAVQGQESEVHTS